MVNDMSAEQVYGNGSNSSIGTQFRTDYYEKKALVEAAKEQYFGQLADVKAMPKNMGKTIKQYHYMPILDDRNLNDQGIDANGVLAANVATDSGDPVAVVYIKAVAPAANGGMTYYFRGESGNATWATAAANALLEAKGNVNAFLYDQGFTVTQVDVATDYTNLTAAATGWTFTEYAATVANNYGNLYGSSKDIGTITGKIPALGETGGRVNRVGMKRIDLTGTIAKFGFFDEYSQESLDFDTDSELQMHMTTEMVKAANEITEDQLQIDLINGAGVVRLTGGAAAVTDLQGNDVTNPFASDNTNDAVTYDDLVKLAIELDNNRCPKNTRIISGSRMVDTKVVNAARYMYIGSELQPSIMRMTDYHSNKAFIPVAQYASAGNVARGEFGAIDNFRIIVVPEMMHWKAAGAAVTEANLETTSYRYSGLDETGVAHFDVFPMLVVGDGSFATIGFQTDGKSVKFKIKHVKPSENYSTQDPFGETGFMSIKWYYGTMILRSERIALIKTIAEW